MDAAPRRRQVVRSRWCRLRLCDLRLARGPARTARSRPATGALRGDDRSLRGVGQRRPAVLRRSPGVAYRQSVAGDLPRLRLRQLRRSEEHTSELHSLMRISYAVFCLKKKTIHTTTTAQSEIE